MTSKTKVKAALKELANPEKAAFFPRFFKTGPGQYGEGDKFLGVTVPNQRKVARQFRQLPRTAIVSLLDDPLHECRLTALLIMVLQFERGDEQTRQQLVDLYFEKMDRVNNWDLVDSSAHKILGEFLLDKDRSVLDELAATDHLWRQRISIVATLQFIKNDDFGDTLRIADALLDHEHDLIHKAVGWMLREMGKRDEATLIGFLKSRYGSMPRTMLRYAIERFSAEDRQRYLAGEV